MFARGLEPATIASSHARRVVKATTKIRDEKFLTEMIDDNATALLRILISPECSFAAIRSENDISNRHRAGVASSANRMS
jgi:hypothetical protein